MITLDNLTKFYRVAKKRAGLRGTLRGLVHRDYEEVRAVDGLSFHIAPGERVGFLGPNGAGKTTTLKMLAGLLEPTSGTARVLDQNPRLRRREFLCAITLVMGQKQQLLWDLPPRETFELNRAIYDISDGEYRRRLDELVSLLDIGALLERPTRNLSLGERMKCELCAALLHQPRVLFLDEPTIGLDVSMQSALRGFIREYNERHGVTVLLTSHYMNDVEALCRRVILIDGGRLKYDGDLGELVRNTLPDKRIVLRFSRPVERADIERYGAVLALSNEAATVQVARPELQGAVARVIAELPVADLSVEDPPLEDVMRQLFKKAAPPGDGGERARAV